MIRTMRFTVAALALSTCACAARGLSVPTPTGSIEIPSKVMSQIEHRFKGASLSTRAAQCPNGSAASPNPVFVGDVNGDGLSDLMIRMDIAGSPHLFAALGRVKDDYDVVDATGSAPAPEGTLTLASRGATYRPAGLAVDSYFGQDTLLVTHCDGTRTAFLWTGESFDVVTLESAPAPAGR
jgi:hypothetical protein